MRLIQVEQSVVFKISYRLLAGEVCADRVHATKNEPVRLAILVESRVNRTSQPALRFRIQTQATMASLNCTSVLRESRFTAKQKPTGQLAAPGPLEQKI